MSANRHGGRGCHLQRFAQYNSIPRHLEGAKQLSHTEKNAARVVANNEDRWRSPVGHDWPNPESFRPWRSIIGWQAACDTAGERLQLPSGRDSYDWSLGIGRPDSVYWQS